MRRFCLLVVLLAAAPALAQDALLVLRAAYIPDPSGLSRSVPDTTAMERSTLDGETIYLGEVLLDWSDGAFTSVSVESDPMTGAPQLSLVLADAAAFHRVTTAQVDKPIAIVYDGRVLTAPTVNGAIPNGRVQITGQFSRDEADELAAQLRDVSGAQDGRAAAVQALRAAADWSTPEAAMRTFLRAAELRDWRIVAQGFHPAILQTMREDAEERLLLTRGTVSLREPALMDPPPEGGRHRGEEPAEPTPLTWAVARILDASAPGPDWSDFSDEQIAVLYLTVFSAFMPSVPTFLELDLVGTLRNGDDEAFIVLAERDAESASPAESSARVFKLRRLDARWHVLLPLGDW